MQRALKRSFAKYRSTILGPILERLKEKKQTVTDALAAALDAVFMATNLGDIQSDVLEAMTNKNPQIKEHSAKFLVRSLKTTREAPTPEQTKELAAAGKKLLTESAAPLRDAGAEELGVLWKIMGDRNMLSHLDGLDDIRKNKIKEFSDAAEVKAKWKPKAAPPPAPKAAPAGKKAPAGKRPAGTAAAKKPAARAASPPLEDLQPRPSSKPGTKPGVRPPGGLKPPGSGLQKPGSGLKPPSGTASPKRQGMVMDDAPVAPPKSGPGRGLAGRPLGKPSAPSSPPPAQRAESTQSSTLSSMERQELSELRSTVEMLQQQNSDLRNDKLKLTSQITELQNQNAQLIEDHTRDVLQIKAKETQLVRARSDAETSEDRANSLSKEIDRLKREMNRLGRARNGSSDIPEENGDLTPAAEHSSMRPPYSTTSTARSFNSHSGMGGRTYSSESYEGKENLPDLQLNSGKGAPPPYSQRPMSNGSSGRATPLSNDGEGMSARRSGGAGGQDGEGVESWRRAAEVTQNLKARIEMMKVSLYPCPVGVRVLVKLRLLTLWNTGSTEYWSGAVIWSMSSLFCKGRHAARRCRLGVV